MSECCPDRIAEYLSGELPKEAMMDVESHLATCESCRLRLEREAAPAAVWSHAKSMLTDDTFDGPISNASFEMADVDGSWSAESEDGETESESVEASMVTREIRGWLDPTDDPNMIGRFAGYEVVGVVGHGEMGIVLKGFEPSLNRFVAIKAMAPRLASCEAARKRFSREAQATAAVLHENVVAIHRVDKTHGLPFLVMPYLGGESLQRRIDNNGPLGLETSLQVAAQIAAGLAAAHARGLIHRDIKPANILLPHGVQRVTITDFGLARAADETSVTRTGIIAGTPPYMSPEQARGQTLDGRSDLFSLGSVLYAMLTARLPFDGRTNHEIVHRVATERPEPMQTIDPSIPDWAVRLVDWLHEKSAESRPESAAETQRVIDACLLHLQNADSPLPARLSNASRSPYKKLRTNAAIIMSVIVLGAASALAAYSPWLGMGSSKRSPEETHHEQSGASAPSVDIGSNEWSTESLEQELQAIESEILDLEQSQRKEDL